MRPPRLVANSFKSAPAAKFKEKSSPVPPGLSDMQVLVVQSTFIEDVIVEGAKRQKRRSKSVELPSNGDREEKDIFNFEENYIREQVGLRTAVASEPSAVTKESATMPRERKTSHKVEVAVVVHRLQREFFESENSVRLGRDSFASNRSIRLTHEVFESMKSSISEIDMFAPKGVDATGTPEIDMFAPKGVDATGTPESGMFAAKGVDATGISEIDIFAPKGVDATGGAPRRFDSTSTRVAASDSRFDSRNTARSAFDSRKTTSTFDSQTNVRRKFGSRRATEELRHGQTPDQADAYARGVKFILNALDDASDSDTDEPHVECPNPLATAGTTAPHAAPTHIPFQSAPVPTMSPPPPPPPVQPRSHEEFLPWAPLSSLPKSPGLPSMRQMPPLSQKALQVDASGAATQVPPTAAVSAALQLPPHSMAHSSPPGAAMFAAGSSWQGHSATSGRNLSTPATAVKDFPPAPEAFPVAPTASPGQNAMVTPQSDITNSWQARVGLLASQKVRMPPPGLIHPGSEAGHANGARPFLSLGSIGHPELCMRPCVWFAAGRCPNGEGCGFCHADHVARPMHLDKRNRESLKSLSFSECVYMLEPMLRQKAFDAGIESAVEDVLALLHGSAYQAAGAAGVPQKKKTLNSKQTQALLRPLSAMSFMSLIMVLINRPDAPQVMKSEAMLSIIERTRICQALV